MRLSVPSGLILALGAFGLSQSAFAGYGLLPPASGAQSAGVANAILATTNDTDALNLNPAGLHHIERRRADAMVESFYWLVSHEDDLGGKSRPDKRAGAIATGGYAHRLGPRWVVGAALAVQGGVGFVYEDLENAFGAPDDVSATFGSFKLVPGASWQITDRLTLGLSIGLVYSSADQKLLPHTSVEGFSGFKLEGLDGFSTNARAGLTYAIDPRWTVAAVYATRTPIRLRGGRMTLDRSLSDQPPLVYRNARLSGLNFASEASVGLAYRASPQWTLSTTVTRVNWSSALDRSHLKASDPDDDTAAPTLSLQAPLNFRDQYIVAVGAAYQWTASTVLRAGVGYARNPQRDDGLSPAINLVSDRTATLGFGHALGSGWELTGAALYQPPRSEGYTSPLFGGDARETFGAAALYLSLSRAW